MRNTVMEPPLLMVALTTTHTVAAPMATNMDLLNMATRPCTTTMDMDILALHQATTQAMGGEKVDETLG